MTPPSDRAVEAAEAFGVLFVAFVCALPDLWAIYLFFAAVMGWWPWA